MLLFVCFFFGDLDLDFFGDLFTLSGSNSKKKHTGICTTYTLHRYHAAWISEYGQLSTVTINSIHLYKI